MRKRRIILSIFVILGAILAPIFAYSRDFPEGAKGKLIIFYSPGCHRCIELKDKLMPEIKEEFQGKIQIEYRDIADIKNYKLLLGLKEKYKAGAFKITLPLFFLSGRFLEASQDIGNNLRRFISESLISPPDEEGPANVDLTARFKSFRLLTIFGAGLIDGINPCAFTVIVFFISFLALQGYRKRELMVIGLSFIFAVFVTYLFIGLGLFGFLYELKGFWLLPKIFNVCVGIFSVVLGIICLYDIFKFSRTGKTEGLILQLPAAVKNQIHKVIGLRYRVEKTGQAGQPVLKKHIFSLFLTALITGFLVSLLEAICTGQTYLPTIAFVLKTTPLKLEAAGLLLLYNLMFIAPLFVIFIFALWGVSSGQFAAGLRSHLLTVKILMAILFFGLGIFLLWRV